MSQLQNAWGYGGLGSRQLGSQLGWAPGLGIGSQLTAQMKLKPWNPETFEEYQADALFDYAVSGEYRKHTLGKCEIAVGPLLFDTVSEMIPQIQSLQKGQRPPRGRASYWGANPSEVGQ